MLSALRTPSGQSQRTCRAIVGQTPVSRCTCPASLNFSSVVVAAAGWLNLPNLVPVFANPQDGSSMRKDSSALKIFSVLCASIKDLAGFYVYEFTNFVPEKLKWHSASRLA